MGDFATFKIKLVDMISPQLKQISNNFGVSKKGILAFENTANKSIKSISHNIASMPKIQLANKGALADLTRLKTATKNVGSESGKSFSMLSNMRNATKFAGAKNPFSAATNGLKLMGSLAGMGTVGALTGGLGLVAIAAFKVGQVAYCPRHVYPSACRWGG